MDRAKRIVELHLPRAYAIAFRLTGNRQDAWDLAQSAMVKVLRKFEQYDPKYKVEQWLHGILRNLYVDRLRMASVRREDPLDEPVVEGGRSHADRLVDREPGPEAHVEREFRREAVRRALSGLPAETRAALVLVDMEGLSYEEAARVAGVPVSTLGVRVFRGRKALRRLLERAEEG